MDYSKYQFSGMQIAKLMLKALLLTLMISVLFYSSVWGMLLAPLIFVILMRKERRQCIEERKRELHGQFIDCLKVVSNSLMAGMSMENSWKEATREIGQMHGTEGVLYLELKELNSLVETNVPVEKVLLTFAYRTGITDIISFAEVFEYGKRSGGNWKKIIEDTTFRMAEKYETEEEITVMLAAKKMEQKVMNVIPPIMIGFLRISSGDYMDCLYGNPLGVVCMSVCLLGYVAALYLAERVMKIQV